MQPLTRPYLEVRTYGRHRLFWVMTICGVLVSRPTAGEAMAVFGDQEALWKAIEAEAAHV